MEAALHPWSDFNVAMVGATAALAGLVIVAASVNIAQIIESGSRSLIARMASSIASLVLALVASALGLLPGITEGWFSGILIGATALSAGFQISAARAILTERTPAAPFPRTKSTVGFLPVAAYFASGITVAMGHPAGLYLAALGSGFAIIVALITAWVTLVEVLR